MVFDQVTGWLHATRAMKQEDFHNKEAATRYSKTQRRTVKTYDGVLSRHTYFIMHIHILYKYKYNHNAEQSRAEKKVCPEPEMENFLLLQERQEPAA